VSLALFAWPTVFVCSSANGGVCVPGDGRRPMRTSVRPQALDGGPPTLRVRGGPALPLPVLPGELLPGRGAEAACGDPAPR
jgi:hypothetical protein